MGKNVAKYRVTVGLSPEFRALLLEGYCNEISEQIKQGEANFLYIYHSIVVRNSITVNIFLSQSSFRLFIDTQICPIFTILGPIECF